MTQLGVGNVMGIQMDGRTYRVRAKFDSLEEYATLKEGLNAGDMLSGDHERDLDGTYLSHALDVEPDPRYPEDYDAFYAAIIAPVNSHSIVMPHGQGTITYDAMVSDAGHRSRGKLAGIRRWTGLRVEFSSIRPVLRPEESTT